MTTVLMVGGVVFWGLVGLVVARKVLRRVLRAVFGPGTVRRWLLGPTMYPYTQFFRYRLRGAMLKTLSAIGLVRLPASARQVVDAHRDTRLDKMKELRDVMQELDRLPIVQKGLQGMGLRSVFDMSTKPPATIASPYTHPLQYPPFFIPGLRPRTFFDPSEFEWAQPLAEAYPMIKEELEGVLHDDGKGFKAYMSEGNQRLAGWNTFNFFFYGRKVEENCERCPRTTELLESLPRFERDHIMFSALNPHAAIPPHVGPLNGIIRAHLGLVVPPGCYVKVGEDERTWEEGKLLIFDDSFLHQVWNHTDQTRIVLFLNFWHPDFSKEEIQVLERYRRAYEQTPESRVHAHNQAAPRGHDIVQPTVAAARA